MTGLMVKDFLVMRKSIKTYILFLAFYFVMAALGIFPISFITAMVQIIIMMLPLSAFSYDEMSKWDRYAFSLPLGRRAVAGARYLFALSLALFAALFGLVSCLVLSGFFHDPNLVENCLTVTVSLALGLLYCDILLPLTYKLGPERARPYFYLVIFLPIILLFVAFKLELLGGLAFLLELPDAVVIPFLLLLPLLPLLGMGISFLISCRILERKEF
ncbi:ABC-2 transporter permease [Pseudoflavonifractor phocaeensis]|uniref:ABC-2 transporter permease n=1 Tax=Pseudoflavonifractor phocaeensis TaxID=1870988 RepID=UPI0025A43FC5|nr:ABC-2 transporter permease [Pseudoflavonifractor phocaeensis]MDM8239777.1 ABC-2 transporter permease [Pseudoflavonifractor phocaeensis]